MFTLFTKFSDKTVTLDDGNNSDEGEFYIK